MSESNQNLVYFPLDINRRELAGHGSATFPCTCYLDCYYNTSYPWHWHDELELAYAEQGSLIISVNEQQYTLPEGFGIFINTGVLHSYSGIRNSSCRFPNILFHPSLICQSRQTVYWEKYMQPLLQSPALSHLILCPDIPWQNEIINRIRLAFRDLVLRDFGYEFTVRNRLSEIVLLICRHCSEQLRQQDAAQPEAAEIRRTRQMLDYIQAHFTEPITLDDISAAACVSRRECLRCFQRITRTSPKQYVTALRLQKAKNLLAGTTLSLSEIGEACGFQDQSYFTKLFRRDTGLPPGQWRRRYSNI